MTLNLPDAIIGAGGAGRAITKSFVEHEWTLRAAIDNGGLGAYFVDTDATVDKTDDIGTVNDEGTFEYLRDQLTEDHGNKGLSAEHINLINDLRQSPTNATLLGQVPAIAHAQNGLNAWWLEDDNTLLTKESNYKGGVNRRRALTKALYHYSRSDDKDPVSNLLTANFAKNDNVAMVVGLGGGSGSGIFIDVARELAASNQIELTLFAVLDDPADHNQDSMANNYAALSELEYLALTGDNPFKSIVLLPSSPYSGPHDEFDEAVAYTITAYYNIHGVAAAGDRVEVFDETADRGPPTFAPFTVAVPQILRYPRRSIEKTEDRLDGFLDAQLSYLGDNDQPGEISVLKEMEEFVEDHYSEGLARGLFDNTGRADSRLEDALYNDGGLYDDRIQNVYELLTAPFLDDIGYKERAQLVDQWDQVRQDVTARDDGELDSSTEREQLIARLAESNWSSPKRGTKDETERKFYEFVDRELETVGRRAALRRVVKDIPDDAIERELDRALNYREKSSGAQLSTYEDLLAELRVAVDSEEIDRIHEAATTERDARLDSWESAVDETVEDFVDLLSHAPEIERHLDDLEKALDDFASAVGGKDGWASADEARQSTLGVDEDDIRELNRHLRQIDVEPIDPETVFDSVDGVQKAGAMKLGKDGPVERFLGKSRQERYGMADQKIDSRVFELSDYEERLSCSYTKTLVANVRGRVVERHQKLRSTIEDSFETACTTEEKISRSDILESLLDALEEVRQDYSDVRDDLVDVFDGGVTSDGLENEKRDVLSKFGVDVTLPESVDTEYERDRRAFVAVLDEIDDDAFETKLRDDERDIEVNADADAAEVTSALQDALDDELTTALVSATTTLQDEIKVVEEELHGGVLRLNSLRRVVSSGDMIAEGWSIEDNRVSDWNEESVTPRPYDVGSIQKRETTTTDGAYVQSITPKEPARLNERDLGSTRLWTEREERSRIIKAFGGRYELLPGSYLGLKKTQIMGTQHTDKDRYNDYVSHTVFLSRLFDGTYANQAGGNTRSDDPNADLMQLISGDSMQVPNPLTDALPETEVPMKFNTVSGGGPWDVTSVTFLGGVFLDNIAPMSGPYWSSYRNEMGKKVDVDAKYFEDGRTIDSGIVRHAYGLDGSTITPPEGADGSYIRRSELMDLGDPESIPILNYKGTDWDDETSSNEGKRYANAVTTALLEEYVEHVGFQTTRLMEE